jgi:hypothetical protein
MKTRAGVWIDHRKAIIVVLKDNIQEIRLTISKVEKQLRRTGDSPLKGPFEAHLVPADDSRQRAFTGSLNAYYDSVIANTRDADAILIFGPGEAKEEFKKRLELAGHGNRIVSIETVDKMTNNQVAARVRKHLVV